MLDEDTVMNAYTNAPYTAFPMDVTFDIPDQQVGSTATERDIRPAPMSPPMPVKPEPVNREVAPTLLPPVK